MQTYLDLVNQHCSILDDSYIIMMLKVLIYIIGSCEVSLHFNQCLMV